MTTRYLRTASLLAVAALSLSACGGSDDDSSEASSSEASQSEESSESEATEEESTEEETEEETTESEDAAAEDDAAAEGGSEELTEPGTELEVGKTATVPQGDDGGTITVTVSKITKGTAADLEQLEDADKYTDYTPVYVEYTMTGTDGSGELGGDILDDVDPITSDGNKAGTLVIVGTSPFEKCDSNSIPDDFGPGDTETTCQVAMLSSGQEIGGAQYAPYEGDYADDGKVVWKQ